jgi:hypothetical protein
MQTCIAPSHARSDVVSQSGPFVGSQAPPSTVTVAWQVEEDEAAPVQAVPRAQAVTPAVHGSPWAATGAACGGAMQRPHACSAPREQAPLAHCDPKAQIALFGRDPRAGAHAAGVSSHVAVG